MVKLQLDLGNEIVKDCRNGESKDKNDHEDGDRTRNPPLLEAIDKGVEQVSNEETDEKKGNRCADQVSRIKAQGRQEPDDPPPDDGGEPSG